MYLDNRRSSLLDGLGSHPLRTTRHRRLVYSPPKTDTLLHRKKFLIFLFVIGLKISKKRNLLL